MQVTAIKSPAEIDTKLASLYYDGLKLGHALESRKRSIISAAGAKWYYRGRQRVTDMTYEEAEEIVNAALAAGTTLLNGHTLRYYGQPSCLELVAEATAALAQNERAQRDLAAEYDGWSRFFLVTSSQGHIHSSMDCSTCRASTTYGWLPELSGKTEAEAVAEHGPALCSVCFPSAPVEWTATKLTKAQAARKVA